VLPIRVAEFVEMISQRREMMMQRIAESIVEGNAEETVALFLMKRDPGLLKEMIAWYGEFELAVAKAMIDQGADIIGAGESVAYFMSPETFLEYVYPFEKDIFGKIHQYGAPVLIHCCGHVPQYVGFASEACPGGAINFDYQVSLTRAKKQIGGSVTPPIDSRDGPALTGRRLA
jgi:uroporphyrinogen-III decarboxylase